MQVGEGQQVQIVQAQPQGQSQQAQSGTGQTMQVMQQIITNTGEIQQIPVRFGQEERWESPFLSKTMSMRPFSVCFFNWQRKFGWSGVFPALRKTNQVWHGEGNKSLTRLVPTHCSPQTPPPE